MGNNAPNASFVARHKPSFLVLASQVSAACIHGIVKILETEESPVHPFRILQVRLFITGISCMLYLWCSGFPDFLLGPKDVRPLLFVRAVGGVCGAIGFYCVMLARVPKVIPPETEHRLADHGVVSIIYLTIAQATALNFLAPMGSMLISRYLDYGSFSVTDRVGALMALAGVVLIVQPDTFFYTTGSTVGIKSHTPHETPKQLKGVVCGLAGVAGGIIALTAIRRIRHREHPLISVNYFAWAVVTVTTILSFAQRLTWPTISRDWCLLVVVGILGTIMEFLLTAGISCDTSSTATIVIYSQVLWALALDHIFWDVSLNLWSIIGVVGVIGSLSMVSLVKELTVSRSVGGIQYEQISPGPNDRTPIIDIESLCDSETGDETSVYDARNS